jgi:signal recognition particle GTPase
MSRDKIPAMTEKLQLPPEQASPRAVEKAGLWQKLKRGLFMTHTEIIDRVGAAVEGRAVLDEGTIEHLEEALLGADLGVETTLELVGRVRQRARRENAGMDQLRSLLREEMAGLLVEASASAPALGKPGVILVVGVNGVGKTTSIAKLARRLQARGESVLLAAGDTFRAAASEQLALWGQRLGVEVVQQSAGSDPASVVFDALQAARSRRVDHVIVDTRRASAHQGEPDGRARQDGSASSTARRRSGSGSPCSCSTRPTARTPSPRRASSPASRRSTACCCRSSTARRRAGSRWRSRASSSCR